MSRCGRKDASSDSAASGGASLTSTRPGRLRWIESATASRYIRGERMTSTRIMGASVPVTGTDAALAGKNGPKCAEGGPRPADGGPSKVYFGELRQREVRRITLPGTRVNEGCEENLASSVKKMSHLKFCHRLRRIHRQFVVGGLNGIA